MPASLATLFLAALLLAGLSGTAPLPVFGFYIVMSLLTFCIYAWDKSAARKQQWRTRERSLHALGLAGGWPGALLAQTMIRHKSKKQNFRVTLWITAVINCCVLLVFLFPGLLFAMHGS